MVHVMSCCAPQNQLQYGAFMVICIRCQAGDLTKHNARQRAIKAALGHEDFSKEVWHKYQSPTDHHSFLYTFYSMTRLPVAHSQELECS